LLQVDMSPASKSLRPAAKLGQPAWQYCRSEASRKSSFFANLAESVTSATLCAWADGVPISTCNPTFANRRVTGNLEDSLIPG
jgi:hypothetical protein